ncbi:hypothetical protein GQ44DRAFT_197447 [Phaeosphaeriaceae sp. PMI808]|nr:hypothetical protein GQ44DRAFT_197447 [Phaeosphaeriaceae sp. PMI808]
MSTLFSPMTSMASVQSHRTSREWRKCNPRGPWLLPNAEIQPAYHPSRVQRNRQSVQSVQGAVMGRSVVSLACLGIFCPIPSLSHTKFAYAQVSQPTPPSPPRSILVYQLILEVQVDLPPSLYDFLPSNERLDFSVSQDIAQSFVQAAGNVNASIRP